MAVGEQAKVGPYVVVRESNVGCRVRYRAEHLPSRIFCYGTHSDSVKAQALALRRIREAVSGGNG